MLRLKIEASSTKRKKISYRVRLDNCSNIFKPFNKRNIVMYNLPMRNLQTLRQKRIRKENLKINS